MSVSTLFGKHTSKVWRAFMVSVPARLFGFVTIPLVGAASGAYQVSSVGLYKAVAIYSLLGFLWALLVEFLWPKVKLFFSTKD